MTPDQALENLDRVAAAYQGTRQDHFVLQTSLSTIKAELAKRGTKEPPTSETKGAS